MRLWLVSALCCVVAVPVLAQTMRNAPATPAASPPATVAPAEDAAAKRAAEKATLEQRLKTLEQTLSGDVCADPAAAEAVLKQHVMTDVSALSPSLALPTAEVGSTPLSRTKLVDRLQQASVIVMTSEGGGSGFFIAPNLILTNSHVVEDGKAREAVVIGRGVNGGAVADVIDLAHGKGANARDYALLKLRSDAAPNATILGFTDSATKLQPVVAAGYPALLLGNDLNFQALLAGDMSGLRGNKDALPDLVLSQGAVMALQNTERGLPTIAHSAPISAGNSGGPLVDECGRVVGINTFISVSESQGANAGFALSSADIVSYLKSKGIVPQSSSVACGG